MELFYFALTIVAALIVFLVALFRMIENERREVLIQQKIEQIKRGLK
jgi:hypothetical protein